MCADRDHKKTIGKSFLIPAMHGILLGIMCLLIDPSLWGDVLARVLPDSFRELREEQLEPIAGVVEQAIQNGQIPGAVILVGNPEQVLYRKAFGYCALVPEKRIMTEDTIFDVASLTKVVATTTAVMQLVEKGKLRLEDPVARYWPAFKAKGKKYITVRQLLTHTSGLRPDLSLKHGWYGNGTALKKIIAERPAAPPGKRVIYSDINFEVLGELVRRVSGQPLDAYCSEHIFKPLGMKDTAFAPSLALRDRIAPTEYLHEPLGRMLWGEVHDPTAYRMGGVAGHAGLFSTADDLSIFARMLLGGGSYRGARILSPRTVEKMTTPQTPLNRTPLRGLGWEINSPAPNKRVLFPRGTYGHTGYTGTSLWIDPDSKTYVIILTNRVHPDGKGDACPLRTDVSMLVEEALGKDSIEQAMAVKGSRPNERMPVRQSSKVQTGIDVLKAEQFASLSGLRIGLITNHSGLDSTGQRTLDLLYHAQGLTLVAIFSPEHGLSGRMDEKIASVTETTTGLPVYSLYGNVLRPTERMLDGLDAMVFDVQDAGVRFYTYITTMGFAMEAAARKGISFYVLDRPNPITGSRVDGPVMDQDLKSFVGYFPLPIRHGMTVGELAKMFNEENGIGVNLHVIRMSGYERNFW
ncbi:MAG TPA: serine hydrolase, partial [Thermodesulfovibrionales bacterium]|nr:serine hydrolase [Thermodesulfovibrionales bacterium]